MNENSPICTEEVVAPVSHKQPEVTPDFRAELSEKLRTPLNAIMGFAELLNMELVSTTSAPNVKHILTAARDLLKVIDQDLSGSTKSVKDSGSASAAFTNECNVLYIEDDLVNFTLVESILKYRPALKLMRAACGEVGVTLAQTHNPSLILLDLNLPDIHGAEVLRRLREQPATAEIPIVIVSADATPSQIERLLAAGAQNYLTKPLNIQTFLAVVDQITQRQIAPRAW